MSAPTVSKSKKQVSDLAFPLFSAGQMLQADQLTQLADYTRALTQLVLRSLFGCGVVCGLCVDAVFKCNKLTVTVHPGVALNCCGDPIHVTAPTTVVIEPDCDFGSFAKLTSLWVLLRGLRKCCAPQPVACPSDSDEPSDACTLEKYWYEIKVTDTLPACVCACIPAKKTDERAQQLADAYPDTINEASGTRLGATLQNQPAETKATDCYEAHRLGECECGCSGCADCDCECEWIVLARIDKPQSEKDEWDVYHGVRRYVRPALERDRGCGQGLTATIGLVEQQTDAPLLQRRGRRTTPTV